MGTYYIQSRSGHVYTLTREEVENLIGTRTDGPYIVGNLVTRKKVKVSDRRPLTAKDVARISNED